MQENIIHIYKTLNVITDAIRKAEKGLQRHINTYYHNANEEFITSVYYGQIKFYLRKASQNKEIENAFIEDLKDAASHMHYVNNWDLDHEISKSADGMIADIVLHNKKQEGKTGGDFGLIVLRPQIQLHYNSIVIKKGVSSGLLCQAKLKNADGKWGPLQPSQERALSKYRDFYSFVLYSYKNDIRNLLNPIRWKVCKDSMKSAIIKSFRADEFDKLESVSSILESLGQSKIGTTDDKIIKEIISPGKKQVLEIKIFNPEDKDPKKEVKIRVVTNQETTAKSKQVQTVKLYRT